jgi:ABC-type bacteriocin/lantibiotic exporter with double-glycine peptidase domain
MESTMKQDQSGLYCLTVLLKMFGVPVETEQIAHQFLLVKEVDPSLNISRALNELGCKSTVVEKQLADIQPSLFPLIAELKSGEFEILAKHDQVGRKVLV